MFHHRDRKLKQKDFPLSVIYTVRGRFQREDNCCLDGRFRQLESHLTVLSFMHHSSAVLNAPPVSTKCDKNRLRRDKTYSAVEECGWIVLVHV